MLNEFKAFINKGNVLDLAVAVIMAAAFGAVIASFVNDILMQIIAAIFGQPDFRGLYFNLGSGVIKYGAFLNAVINFLFVAFAVFLVIRAYNQMRKPTPAETTTKECPYCLSTIPLGATRCPQCTSALQLYSARRAPQRDCAPGGAILRQTLAALLIGSGNRHARGEPRQDQGCSAGILLALVVPGRAHARD